MFAKKPAVQESLFIAGSLSDLIPEKHILKRVNKVLDLSWLDDLVRDCYSKDVGRPCIPFSLFCPLSRIERNRTAIASWAGNRRRSNGTCSVSRIDAPEAFPCRGSVALHIVTGKKGGLLILTSRHLHVPREFVSVAQIEVALRGFGTGLDHFLRELHQLTLAARSG